MGQNSIRCNQNKNDIIAEIRLALSADFEQKKGFVIVEGEDDITFFNGKLHEDIDLLESFSGKVGVEEIVNYFSDDRVIGICDRDYNPVNNPHVFYYDYSCLEMMLISNETTFSNFCKVFYHGSQKPKDIRYQLLSNLKWLSLYRKINSEHGFGIRFLGVSIAKAFNKENLSIDTENLLTQIKKINPELISNKQLELLNEAFAKNYDLEHYLFITQGHDFLNYFQILCEAKKRIKRKSFDSNSLFAGLVCAYHIEDFSKSTLYQELLLYQTTYKIQIIAN